MGDAPELLEPSDGPLHEVPLPVRVLVEAGLSLLVRFGGDHGPDPPLP
jgi:hypothetical protein